MKGESQYPMGFSLRNRHEEKIFWIKIVSKMESVEMIFIIRKNPKRNENIIMGDQIKLCW